MAIYRPPRSPWRGRLIMAGAGLLIGALIVWALLPEGEPSEAEKAAALQTEVIAAEGALEIAEIEYAEAVEQGEVVAAAEYEGAKAALQRSRERFEAASEGLEAGAVGEVEAAYEDVARLMEKRVASDRLASAVKRVVRLLIALRGGELFRSD